MKSATTYFWVRVYDYNLERDGMEKGTLLDEFYLMDIEGGRAEAKQKVLEKYCTNTSKELKFAKPKKKSGIYAIITDTEKYWYDRFYAQIDTFCFWCTKPIKGKASEFPRSYIGDGHYYASRDTVFTDLTQTAYFCTTNCEIHFKRSQKSDEGEFQVKEEGNNGDIFGYIYLIYNRAEDQYYIGQTRYMPFFRWQEHVKEGKKGHISDLSFSVLTEICRDKTCDDQQNQQYLNNMEAWWIDKYRFEGHQVFNISKPKITIDYLKERFNDMVIRQEQMSL
ncbi:GIY-YIG nuclease family protein [Paenibacillus taichungensis]